MSLDSLQAALAHAADLAHERVLPLPACAIMRAKLDESVPNEAAEALRTAGWECDTVHDEGLNGADDARVASVFRDEGRVLFTLMARRG